MANSYYRKKLKSYIIITVVYASMDRVVFYLCPKTMMVMRYLHYIGRTTEGVNVRSYCGFQYDTSGQLTYISIANDPINEKYDLWARRKMDDNKACVFYEDSRGNIWKREWDTPLIFRFGGKLHYNIQKRVNNLLSKRFIEGEPHQFTNPQESIMKGFQGVIP